MDKLYLEIPTITRKQEAYEFIQEHLDNNSSIHGSGSLYRFVNKDKNNYEEWLNKLENDYVIIPNEEKVPARTFFLIRESDNKIIGMINIRLALNERLKKLGGHIGYGIRPSERKKGYNKINLYLGLKICNEYGIGKVLLDADLNNPASWKTMEALGGKRIKEYFEDSNYHCTVVDYSIDVSKALNEYSFYENYISNKNEKTLNIINETNTKIKK